MDNRPKNTDDNNSIESLKKLVDKLLYRIVQLEQRLDYEEKDNIKLIEKGLDIAIEIDELQQRDKQRQSDLKKVKRENEALRKENTKLRDKIYRKNSRNSSIAPAQDPNRPKKNQSLRKKSDKNPGGQEGHKGTTLDFSMNPTQVKEHYATICENCGNELSSALILSKKRQVIDIPPLIPVVIEHRTYRRECACGHCTDGTFPKGAKAPVSYGPRIEAFIAYLSVRQYVPIKRIEELLRQMFGLNISAATICNKLAQSSDKLLVYYSWIHRQIQKSKVVGSDETGCRVNGNRAWIWAWQSELFTYLRYSDNRAQKTINAAFPNGLPHAVMVHDCYSAQFNIQAKGHQICLAHLFRELNFFIETGDRWSINFKHKLKQALLLLKNIKLYPRKNYAPQINKINREVDKLLQWKNKAKGKVLAFIKRIIKRRDALFRFLKDPCIPPDNNASERAIRNVKVKTKVSGMFKTDLGADQFAIIRSVIDTFIKHKQPVMKSLIKVIS
jgi:transposase/FtsZ-binding cell division protein ZapB